MITPEEAKKIVNKRYNLDTIEGIIDREIRENHGQYPWEDVIMDEELPISIRDELAKRYARAGWEYVYHHTSGENEEKPGLTEFMFSMEPIQYAENNRSFRKIRKGIIDAQESLMDKL